MRYKKRASLSLSINAIVVLVLALTMLGLGISFTKNMFGKLGQNLLDKADYKEIPDPTYDEPVSTLDTVSGHQGKSIILPIKVLNDKPNDITVTSSISCGSCSGSSCTSDVIDSSQITPSSLTIKKGRIARLAAKIKIKSNAPLSQSDMCFIQIIDSSTSKVLYSASTTITVR